MSQNLNLLEIKLEWLQLTVDMMSFRMANPVQDVVNRKIGADSDESEEFEAFR